MASCFLREALGQVPEAVTKNSDVATKPSLALGADLIFLDVVGRLIEQLARTKTALRRLLVSALVKVAGCQAQAG
jgi:hypothetical protein